MNPKKEKRTRQEPVKEVFIQEARALYIPQGHSVLKFSKRMKEERAIVHQMLVYLGLLRYSQMIGTPLQGSLQQLQQLSEWSKANILEAMDTNNLGSEIPLVHLKIW